MHSTVNEATNLDHGVQDILIDSLEPFHLLLRGECEVGWKIFLEPGMFPDLGDRDPFHTVHDEHPFDEVPGFLTHVPGDGIHSTSDLPEEIPDVLIIEGKTSTQHRVQNHTAAPDIHLRSSVQTVGVSGMG